MDMEVPIPPGTKLFRDTNPSAAGATNVVLVLYERGRRKVIRLGRKSAREGFMHPNDAYFMQFGGNPAEQRACHFAPRAKLSAGLYAVVLTAAERLGLYGLLVRTLGVEAANAATDCAMALIRTECEWEDQVAFALDDQVTFRNSLGGEPCFSALLSREDQSSYAFMDGWIRHWVKEGISDVYLSADGPTAGCGLDEEGDKHDATHILLWVIVASGCHRGMPLAYVSYRGAQLDSSGIRVLLAKLSSYGLHVACAVLGSGLCTISTVNGLREAGLPFVMGMPEGSEGHEAMMEHHADEIRISSEYYIGNRRFGVADHRKVFRQGDMEAALALIYEPIPAADRCAELIGEVHKVLQQANAKAEETGSCPEIPAPYRSMLCFDADAGEGQCRVSILHGALDAAISRIGYTTLVSSEEMGAREMSEISDMLTPAARACRFLQMSGGEERTPGSTAWERLCALLAEILHHEIELMCSAVDLQVSSFVPLLDTVRYRLSNGSYVFTDRFSPEVGPVLKSLGISKNALRNFGVEISRRYLASLTGRRNGQPEHIVQDAALLTGSGNRSCSENDRTDSGPEVSALWNFRVPLEDRNGDTEISAGSPETDGVASRGECTEDPDGGKLLRSGSAHDAAGKEPRKRGRPRGVKDTVPRHRRTFAELGKPTKKTAVGASSSGKPGRKPGCRDSYKRTRRTKAEILAEQAPGPG